MSSFAAVRSLPLLVSSLTNGGQIPNSDKWPRFPLKKRHKPACWTGSLTVARKNRVEALRPELCSCYPPLQYLHPPMCPDQSKIAVSRFLSLCSSFSDFTCQGRSSEFQWCYLQTHYGEGSSLYSDRTARGHSYHRNSR